MGSTSSPWKSKALWKKNHQKILIGRWSASHQRCIPPIFLRSKIISNHILRGKLLTSNHLPRITRSLKKITFFKNTWKFFGIMKVFGQLMCERWLLGWFQSLYESFSDHFRRYRGAWDAPKWFNNVLENRVYFLIFHDFFVILPLKLGIIPWGPL